MSTSDTKIGRKNLVMFIFITFFCMLFTFIYEKFSYGEYSWHMRGMFLYPLLGGVAVSLIFWKKTADCWSVRLWNSAVAVFTCGSLIHGIIAISGRSSAYDRYYRIVGVIFAAGAMAINYSKKIYRRKHHDT